MMMMMIMKTQCFHTKIATLCVKEGEDLDVLVEYNLADVVSDTLRL